MPDPQYVKHAFARIADRYVMTNHVLSGGIDFWWRHVVTEKIQKLSPSTLLDVASGTGDLALKIQKEIPSCEVLATDFCPEMLAHASSRGVKQTLVADALSLPFSDEAFDVVTVAFGLRNMGDYPAALLEMRRVLKPNGTLFILDFSQPKPPISYLYRPYLLHVLPKLAGLLTGQKDAYEYLGTSIEQFPYGTQMIELLSANGLHHAVCQPMTFGVVSLYSAVKCELP